MSDNQNPRGASAHVVSTQDVLAAWFSHHRASARLSLQKILAEPLSSLMICLVIGIAIALPLSLFVVAENMKTLSGNWDDNPQISVYLRMGVQPATAQSLGNKLQAIDGVLSVRYISPETALENFRPYAGFGEAVKLLDDNPLPPVYVVQPLTADANAVARLAQQLKVIPEIEFVQFDLEWVQKLQHLLRLAERFIVWFALMLCLGVILTIANTIRLALENRREEIVVVKLVGGTDAFVRRPLLYTGFWYGLGGGIVAVLLVVLGRYLLTEPAQQLALLYQSHFSPRGLAVSGTLAVLLTSALLGLMGAWLATARYFRQQLYL